jgi:hypothetical protein
MKDAGRSGIREKVRDMRFAKSSGKWESTVLERGKTSECRQNSIISNNRTSIFLDKGG